MFYIINVLIIRFVASSWHSIIKIDEFYGASYIQSTLIIYLWIKKIQFFWHFTMNGSFQLKRGEKA